MCNIRASTKALGLQIPLTNYTSESLRSSDIYIFDGDCSEGAAACININWDVDVNAIKITHICIHRSAIIDIMRMQLSDARLAQTHSTPNLIARSNT